MKVYTRTCAVALFLAFCAVLHGQFPAHTHEVIDYNTTPKLRLHYTVPHFFPGSAPGSFYFGSYNSYPNGYFYFDGQQLDTVAIDTGITSYVVGHYAGGLLLQRTDGSRESNKTFHLDPQTFDTTLLANGHLRPLHTFPGGSRLLRDDRRLYGIDADPASIRLLPYGVEGGRATFGSQGNRLVYATQVGLAITDGTVEGTDLFFENPCTITQLVATDEQIYFTTFGGDLYLSDGTKDGTRQLTFENLPEPQRPQAVGPQLHLLKGVLVFNARLPDGKQELWRTDGSPEGTYSLATPGARDGFTTDSLLIYRSGSSDAAQVWSVTGETGSARLLVDLSDRQVDFADWGGRLLGQLADGTIYFQTNERFGDHSFYLLTPAGEVRRIEVPIDNRGNRSVYLPTATHLFVINRGGDPGLYLHHAEADQLTLLAPLAESTGHIKLSDGGIAVIATGEFGQENDEKTIVYYQNTLRIYPTFRAGDGTSAWPSLKGGAFVQRGDKLFGIGIDQAAGEATLSFDLLTGQTEVFQDLHPYTKDASPGGLQAGGDVAFFTHENVVYGSVAGCQYEALFPGDPYFRVSTLEGTNHSLISNNRNNDALYFTNGTRAGTRKLGPFPYPVSSPVAAFGEHFYYLSGEDGTDDRPGKFRLVRIDGSTGESALVTGVETGPGRLPRGTLLIPAIASTGSAMYFPFLTESGWEIWRSDGSATGTSPHLELSTFGPELFPYDLTGSAGVVSFNLADVGYIRNSKGVYLLREGDEEPIVMADFSTYWPSAIQIAGTTYFTDGDTLFRIGADSRTPEPIVIKKSGIQELTELNDSTLLFTTFYFHDAALWKLHLPTGELTRLLDELPQRFATPESRLAVMDSLVLIGQRFATADKPKLVNLHTGDVLDQHFTMSKIITAVRAGNRYLYIGDGSFYGKEVYVINFGEHTENRPTAVTRLSTGLLPVTAFPNPVIAGRAIQIKLSPAQARYAYRLYAPDGKTVRSGSFTGSTASIPTTGLYPGVYFLQVYSENQRTVGTARVVIAG